jgi:hypothetical protein
MLLLVGLSGCSGGDVESLEQPTTVTEPGTSTASPTRTRLPVAVPAPTEPPPTTTHPAPPLDCHPSYPAVCIPPAPPDLNCGDIPHRRFVVVAPDSHGFDGDSDGVGCES